MLCLAKHAALDRFRYNRNAKSHYVIIFQIVSCINVTDSAKIFIHMYIEIVLQKFQLSSGFTSTIYEIQMQDLKH